MDRRLALYIHEASVSILNHSVIISINMGTTNCRLFRATLPLSLQTEVHSHFEILTRFCERTDS